jgi:hypothetical protein
MWLYNIVYHNSVVIVYCVTMYIKLHVSAPVMSHLQACSRNSYILVQLYATIFSIQLYLSTTTLYTIYSYRCMLQFLAYNCIYQLLSLKMAHYRSRNM